MREAFVWVIRTYGQKMACFGEDGGEIGQGMAIVQPMTEANWQHTAGTLGAYSTDRLLGLAEPELPVSQIGPGGWLEWGGDRFEVMTVRPIRFGNEVTHLWMALRPARESAP